MTGEHGTTGRRGGSWWWRGVAALGLVFLTVSVTLGLVWFFSDPQPDSGAWLELLSWRAGVVGMFAGTGIGLAALVVSVLALRAQKKAEQQPDPTSSAAPEGALEPEGGIGTGAAPSPAQQPAGPSQLPAASAEQERQSDGPPRSYGGDHIEFRGDTFSGPVIGKQVNQPASPPAPPPTNEEDLP
ncbi:hypothetical protein [Nonomuraea sp. NPDC050310]|uniref:hypothetical protein n=1 Tax=Nonomuraea sp. NPDC050310 TaxID=3154935 RepID=UPI003402DEDD